MALLEKYRQGLIQSAVTGQIDVRTGQPYPVYKDSGVEWLGEVPTHWNVRRLGTAVDMRVSNVDKHTKEWEYPVRLCNYADVYGNQRISADVPFMVATASREEIDKFRLAIGDVLITKDSEDWKDIGVPSLVECADDDLVCGYHLAMLRPIEAVLAGSYLYWTLTHSSVAWQFHINAAGVTRYGLSKNGIRSAKIPLPPLSEQRAIADYLDRSDRRIRRYIGTLKRRITLLEEYRQTLISNVVTGKLDVREAAAARLPKSDRVTGGGDETDAIRTK